MCEACELHKMYLERIIKLQADQIEYLKDSQFNKGINSTSYIKEDGKDNDINNSIFDIIDYNIQELDINEFVRRIEYKYPAKDTLSDIIYEIIIHNEHTLLSKEKSNIIKYLNQDNKIMYENIEIFSVQICNYIFDHLKPIIENYLLNILDSEIENIKENNRVQNIMLLKDRKFAINSMSKIINRLK